MRLIDRPQSGRHSLPDIQLDINGNGIFDDAFGFDPILTWEKLTALGIQPHQTYDVRVRVDDTFGGITTSATVSLQVVPEPSSWMMVSRRPCRRWQPATSIAASPVKASSAWHARTGRLGCQTVPSAL